MIENTASIRKEDGSYDAPAMSCGRGGCCSPMGGIRRGAHPCPGAGSRHAAWWCSLWPLWEQCCHVASRRTHGTTPVITFDDLSVPAAAV